MSRRTFAVALAAGLAGGLALAGCAQEGKLIQAPLPVRGVALEYDFVRRGFKTSATVPDTTVTNLRFKVLVHTENACEAGRSVLQLRRFTGPDVYEIEPGARYNADDPCVLETPVTRDTALTLFVTGVTELDTQAFTFRVTSSGGLPFTILADSTVTTQVANTVQFEVHVQDAATAAPVQGATVAIDSLAHAGGGAVALGSGTSDGAGLFTLNVPCTGAQNTTGPAYRVTVTLGPAQQVFSVPSLPTRCGRRELVYIRI